MTMKDKFKNFFAMEDEYEYRNEEPPERKKNEGRQEEQNIVNLASIQQPNSKVVLTEPKTYDEAQKIADHIVNRRAVCINLQRIEHAQAKRIVDFLSGTVYALNGDIQKLGAGTFLCTPDNMEITGAISDGLNTTAEDLNKGW